MKEKIYTIPLTDAFLKGGECPFCTLEKELETEQVTYALGASMMEPDSRILSNEKGYCRHHFKQMNMEGQALSLALVLDTHMNELIQKLEDAASQPEQKGRWFKKPTEIDPVTKVLNTVQIDCLICDKLQKTLEKFAEVFWYLYRCEADFKKKVLSSSGFCLPHFALLLACAPRELSGEKLKQAKRELTELEINQLKRINEEVNWFTRKFDYRYQNEPWERAKDAPARAMEKLAKFL